MKHLHPRSKSSLFLMEMILALLFFSLSCSVCVQILFAAYRDRHEARLLNHLQEITSMSAEALEAWDGKLSDYEAILSDCGLVPAKDAPSQDGTLVFCFDRSFESSSPEDALYRLELTLRLTESAKELQGALLEKAEDGSFSKSLHSYSVRFPRTGKEGEE